MRRGASDKARRPADVEDKTFAELVEEKREVLTEPVALRRDAIFRKDDERPANPSGEGSTE